MITNIISIAWLHSFSSSRWSFLYWFLYLLFPLSLFVSVLLLKYRQQIALYISNEDKDIIVTILKEKMVYIYKDHCGRMDEGMDMSSGASSKMSIIPMSMCGAL